MNDTINQLSRNAKVAEFDISLCTAKDVRWFDVSVDDVKVVYGLDPPDELGKNADGFLEGEDLVD